MRFKNLSSKIRSGLYHHRAVGEFQGLRLHLRVEEDGSGILIINGSRMLFLNRTATEHIHLFLHGMTEDAAVKEIQRKFKVDRETARKDHRDILFTINTFAKTADVDPVSYLGVEKIEPFEKELSAPYRMELAVTYRCDTNCFIRGSHVMNELGLNEWCKIMDKLYTIGIPHVVFTGGEPTLRDDLSKLIDYSQKRDLVSGLVTNGRKLKDATYLDSLITAGLDHIQITIESHDEKIHDKITGVEGSWRDTLQGLKNAIETPIYTITVTTLTQINIKEITQTIEFLHNLGLKQFACRSLPYFEEFPRNIQELTLDEKNLKSKLIEVANYSESLGMDFIYYTPQNHILKSSELEQGIMDSKACWSHLFIEPDGTVIPYQNYVTPLGNLLTDDWKKIWNHPICLGLRNKATL